MPSSPGARASCHKPRTLSLWQGRISLSQPPREESRGLETTLSQTPVTWCGDDSLHLDREPGQVQQNVRRLSARLTFLAPWSVGHLGKQNKAASCPEKHLRLGSTDVETDDDHHLRGYGSPQEGRSTPGYREGHGSEKVPEGGAPRGGWSSSGRHPVGGGPGGNIPAKFTACAKAQNVYTLVRLFI